MVFTFETIPHCQNSNHAGENECTEGSCLMRLLVLEKIRISQNSLEPNWAKIAKKIEPMK
jgi:hypothetical protein